MEIFLRSLNLRNFKGIKELDIDFAKKTVISADNGLGKTTIFDAYSWLLWDKDSLNRKDFDIKPFDKDGETIHNLESSVEGVLVVDGEPLKLAKVYKEVWTKKRGSLVDSFTGNTTNYFIQDVPVKKNDYTKRIETLISEKEFYLLSNPKYFNETLDKLERKKMLFSYVDRVEKKDIVLLNPDIKKLNLDDYELVELKAMAKASCKKINQEIQSIPARVDELNGMKNDYDFKAIESRKEVLEEAINNLDLQLKNFRGISDSLKEKSRQIMELEAKKRGIEKDLESKRLEEQAKYDREFYMAKNSYMEHSMEVDNKVKIASNDLTILETRLTELNETKARKNSKLVALRNEYDSTRSRKFDSSLNCPTCGREYGEEKKEEILTAFNLNLSRDLEELSREGFKLSEDIKVIDEELADLVLEIGIKEEELNRAKIEQINLESFREVKKTAEELPYPRDYFQIIEQIESLEKELEGTKIPDNSTILEARKRLEEELKECILKLSGKDKNAEIGKRIKELEGSERDLAGKFEEEQEILFLCDEYTRIEAELVEKRVNNLFDLIQVKLFDNQINGELIETCEVTINGVPYRSLNSAGQTKAGLDVIKSIGRLTDIRIPIFIDNAESITKIPDVGSQTIKLLVKEGQNELKIEEDM